MSSRSLSLLYRKSRGKTAGNLKVAEMESIEAFFPPFTNEICISEQASHSYFIFIC